MILVISSCMMSAITLPNCIFQLKFSKHVNSSRKVGKQGTFNYIIFVSIRYTFFRFSQKMLISDEVKVKVIFQHTQFYRSQPTAWEVYSSEKRYHIGLADTENTKICLLGYNPNSKSFGICGEVKAPCLEFFKICGDF